MIDVHETRLDEVDDVTRLFVDRNSSLNESMVRPVVAGQLFASATLLTLTDRGSVIGAAVQGIAPGAPVGHVMRYLVIAAPRVGEGLTRRLLERLDDRLPPGTTQLRAGAGDDDPHAVAVTEHWGYLKDQLSITSVLELDGLPQVVLPDGVGVDFSYDYHFADDAAVDAMLDASQTNPERLREGPSTLEKMRANANPSATALCLVLRKGSIPVAIVDGSWLGDVAQIYYTGVDPAYRGHGFARLAKQVWHQRVREAGVARAMTNNEENNHGIRRVNAELGYVKVAGNYWLRKPLVG